MPWPRPLVLESWGLWFHSLRPMAVGFEGVSGGFRVLAFRAEAESSTSGALGFVVLRCRVHGRRVWDLRVKSYRA